jgi:hypothetical protein
MAELRRKLVIVGDGACGKTCLLMYVLDTILCSTRLSLMSFCANLTCTAFSPKAHSQRSASPPCFTSHLHPGRLSWLFMTLATSLILGKFYDKSKNTNLTNSIRFMSPPSSRTTLPMLRWTASTWNWHYGIPPGRKTTIVSDLSPTPTHTSS